MILYFITITFYNKEIHKKNWASNWQQTINSSQKKSAFQIGIFFMSCNKRKKVIFYKNQL